LYTFTSIMWCCEITEDNYNEQNIIWKTSNVDLSSLFETTSIQIWSLVKDDPDEDRDFVDAVDVLDSLKSIFTMEFLIKNYVNNYNKETWMEMFQLMGCECPFWILETESDEYDVHIFWQDVPVSKSSWLLDACPAQSM